MFGAYGLRVWLMVLFVSVKRLIISGIQRVNQYDLTQIVQKIYQINHYPLDKC